MIRPYYEEPNIAIYCGDCLEIMKEMPGNLIDLIVTDPPYGTDYKKIMGNENTKLFKESLIDSFRILKNDKFFITYCYPKFLREIIDEAEKIGFEYKWVGFNYYPNMFKQKPQPLGYNRYDLFIIFGKGNPRKSDYMKDVVHISMDKNKPLHPNEKPFKAIEKIVKCASAVNDTILDPFVGSGTTLVACKKLNRKGIGIEIDQKYCDMAIQRLKNTTPNSL